MGWATLAGIVLVAAGLLGFLNTSIIGSGDNALLRTDKVHNIVHLVTGLIALYIAFGLKGEQQVDAVLGFGVLYVIIFVAVLVSPTLFGIFSVPSNAPSTSSTPPSRSVSLASATWPAQSPRPWRADRLELLPRTGSSAMADLGHAGHESIELLAAAVIVIGGALFIANAFRARPARRGLAAFAPQTAPRGAGEPRLPPVARPDDGGPLRRGGGHPSRQPPRRTTPRSAISRRASSLLRRSRHGGRCAAWPAPRRAS